MDRKITGVTNTRNWEADFNPLRSTVFTFNYADRELFDCDGVELGFLKEIHGMRKHLRFHTSDKISWYSVDSEVIQPFGPEPVIRRKIEQSGNFMRVTTDVLIKDTMPLKFLKIDTLKIHGEWENITFYYQSCYDRSDILSKEINFNELNDKGISFDMIPLVVLFTDKNGIQLEIGTGYDLWRWNSAARFSAKNKFILKKEKDYIVFERIPVFWDNEQEVQKFNFRFSWYFSWGKKTATESKIQKNITTLFLKSNKLSAYQPGICNYKLDYSNWPEPAKTSNSNEPCWASRQAENLLKDFLRKTLPKMNEKDKFICLHGISSHICFNSGHMERNKPETFVHWDYWDMMVLWEWANKFFVNNDKKLMLIPDLHSLFSALPSFRGMAGLLED